MQVTTNAHTRAHKSPCIEKPNSLMPVENAAMLHIVHMGALDACQGVFIFMFRKKQVRGHEK